MSGEVFKQAEVCKQLNFKFYLFCGALSFKVLSTCNSSNVLVFCRQIFLVVWIVTLSNIIVLSCYHFTRTLHQKDRWNPRVNLSTFLVWTCVVELVYHCSVTLARQDYSQDQILFTPFPLFMLCEKQNTCSLFGLVPEPMTATSWIPPCLKDGKANQSVILYWKIRRAGLWSLGIHSRDANKFGCRAPTKQ